MSAGTRAGLVALVHAEWTKFRTVRAWVVAVLGAALGVMAMGLAPGENGSCGTRGPDSACVLPVGPGGQEVSDSYYFVHRPLTADGSLTVRVTSLTGLLPAMPTDPTAPVGTRPGVIGWAKAGLIVRASTRPGAAYAAIMVTGAHGVRMQDNYTGDVAGPPGTVTATSPRWLRLTRTGDRITGEASADGTRWTTVARVRLPGLPATVPAGLFTTSPPYAQTPSGLLGPAGAETGPTRATAVFDHLDGKGGWSGGPWTGEAFGLPDNAPPLMRGEFTDTGGTLTVSGSGDIAPAVAGATGLGTTVTQTLIGTFLALIAVTVVATLFITAEYRRGLIHTTLSATPRRGGVLAAKAAVVGAVAFATGLVAAAVVVTLGQRVLRDHGVYLHPATVATQVRLVVGTAALLAVAAVLALAIGALLRRSAAAVASVVVLIVLPYLLAISVLPAAAAQWLLRISPAAAFAIQQSAPRYPQVDNLYTPASGYFPLPPWAGLGVLVGWAALAMGLAVVAIRRRDA
ncbi:ABC transporter permease subunit [Rugosimonospora africana]|uniref:ABC-type transport system involved in multi-copper enzyme maturation, permease component n=1 Tax=Rugosimonospora africana TaxID=556532 RepID=A0A8J3VU98_9ACTN|nr:ABC transporter permease subunit [Rugosimonospora africana]GIH18403.1 hypothetical protein Raf01_65750 [Rugosimonospora africana]